MPAVSFPLLGLRYRVGLDTGEQAEMVTRVEKEIGEVRLVAGWGRWCQGGWNRIC